MTEKPNEKVDKAQFEGIINGDKVFISDKDGIEELHNNSYIGTLEEDESGDP